MTRCLLLFVVNDKYKTKVSNMFPLTLSAVTAEGQDMKVVQYLDWDIIYTSGCLRCQGETPQQVD